MTELPPEIEQCIADMSADDFDMLLARTRPPEENADPKARAVAALRAHRGTDRKHPATKQQAADGFRRAATGRD